MKKAKLVLSLLAILSLTGMASADVIFSDDFTGANGTSVDASKWTIGLGGTSTANIADNAADLCAQTGNGWQAAEIISKVGGDFLTAGNTVTYTAKVRQTGSSEAAAIFGIAGVLEFTSWANGDWTNRSIKLTISGTEVWSGTWQSGEFRNLSIVMTPTTYNITLANATTTSGSLSGTHSIASSDGTFKFVDLAIGGSWTHVYVDDVVIDQVPEPVTMSLLAVGGLGVLIRRKK